jgi:hypothetical protein
VDADASRNRSEDTDAGAHEIIPTRISTYERSSEKQNYSDNDEKDDNSSDDDDDGDDDGDAYWTFRGR